jgi:hypothetical protein
VIFSGSGWCQARARRGGGVEAADVSPIDHLAISTKSRKTVGFSYSHHVSLRSLIAQAIVFNDLRFLARFML